MCRIAGIASPSLSLADIQQKVKAMCQVQRHGGPDGEGFFTSPEHNLVLGHRRLAILDLKESGRQPMHYAGNRYTITYNGEIYNYRELKEELRSHGYHFRSESDTEVVLAAFAAWGTAAFAKFNGMFAFALFDAATADLYLVRDTLGIKPLYYYTAENTLVFASEVRAFAQWNDALEPHPAWPVYFMAYGFLPEPVTTYKEVRPLKGGTFLKYNTVSGRKTTGTFERYSFLEKVRSREALKDEVATILAAAVKRHLLSDAPIGVFLSGGIDSSILSLLAGEQLGEKLETVSVHFNEEAFSEKCYQDKVRQILKGPHRQHLLAEADFHLALPEIIEAADLPSYDGINTWFIAKKAAEGGLKTVLSGLGGDELFGGYPSFRRIGLAAAFQAAPPAILRAARYQAVQKYKRLAYLALPGIRGQYLFLRGIFVPSAIAAYLDMDEREAWEVLEEEPVFPDLHHLSGGNRAGWMELNIYLQSQLLRDADTASMAHGLEIRVPFLDKALVKAALSMQSKEKFRGPYPKQLLIDAFSNRLPPEVWQRKKAGFTFPFTAWLKADEWTKSKLNAAGKAPAGLLQDFEEGRLHWSGLMTALLLETHSHATQPALFNA